MTDQVGARHSGRWPIYPVLLAICLVITLQGNSATTANALWRPLIVAGLLATTLLLSLALIGRNRHVAAYVVAVMVVGVASLELAFAAIALPAAWVLFRMARRAAGRIPWSRVTYALNRASFILLAIGLVNAAIDQRLIPTQFDRTPIGEAMAGTPDMFVILLDAYPRADELVTEAGIDNTPWLTAMANEGFEVASASRSNYNATALTIVSMFEYKPIQEQEGLDPAAPPVQQYRALNLAINEGRALADLHEAGYEVIALGAPFDSVSVFAADTFIDDVGLSEFEISLFRQPGMKLALGGLQRSWLADRHRDALRWTFDELEGVAAEPHARPRFVWAHILAPHPPLAFNAAGGSLELPACYPHECSIWDSGMRDGIDVVKPRLEGHLAWTNARVLEAVRSIKASADQPPVIVVLSDHGFRWDLDNKEESTASLFLAATPGHRKIFPDSVTPINLVPRLLNAYADMDINLAAEDSFWVDIRQLGTKGPLVTEPVN